jgi:hypothetical protein
MKYLLIMFLLISACAKPDSSSPSPNKCGDKSFNSVWTNKADFQDRIDLTKAEFNKQIMDTVGLCYIYSKYDGDECSGTLTSYTIDERSECLDYNFKVNYSKSSEGLRICQTATLCEDYR